MGFAHRNALEGSRLNERDENSCEKVLFSINTRPLPNRLSGSIVDTNNSNPSFYRRWLGSRRLFNEIHFCSAREPLFRRLRPWNMTTHPF